MPDELKKYVIEKARNIKTKEELEELRMDIAKRFKLVKVPSNVDINNMIDNEIRERLKDLLIKKPTRTISGVTVVAIMTSPYSCPHGRCTYCPGGVEVPSPQSYTGYEPAALRGKQNNYDPYLQTKNRLEQLSRIGHPTDKIDLIIMGGTFTARDENYQKSFIKGALDAMNGFISDSLEVSILENEKARSRCIGLTVETRPDWFYEKEIDLALSYGTTKVELGVQSTYDDVYDQTLRGHRVQDVIRSTQLSKDAGFKVLYHIMPGLSGPDMDSDLATFRRIFDNENFRPDMLKIYPTLVVQGTKYYENYISGKYRSYETEEAVELISEYFRWIPNYVRIHRIQRDIPVYKIVQGVKRSDIHDLAIKRALEKGIEIKEIRYREIGRYKDIAGKVNIEITRYNASGGQEFFIEAVDEKYRILSFIRLRFPSDKSHRHEMLDSSIIREIKTFGVEAKIGERGDVQHRGFGRKLLEEAERITSEEGYKRINVISGIGVREYFRKWGYERFGPYMSKLLG
ncbi:MAG: tRNA uridine(34) 5-carboxymethylaminomethyl modification radical SAM/GNAT enzyme Elp3 [Thermoplasmatales archaeon]